MSKIVNININSSHHDGNETEELTMQKNGELYQKSGTYYLKYEDDSKGLEGVKTTLKIKEGEEITLIRQGKVRTMQRFMPAARTEFDYQTPYGTLKLALEVEKWELDIDETVGKINLEYAIYSSKGLVSNNKLEIIYEEE